MAERRSPICDAASQRSPGAYLYCSRCWRTFSTTATRCPACANRPLILAAPPVRPCAQCGAMFNHCRSGRCPRCATPVQRAPPRERSRSRSAPPRAAAEAGTGGDRRPSWSSPREGAVLGGTGNGPPARLRGRVEAALVVGRPLLYTLPRTGPGMGIRHAITPHPGGDNRVGEVWLALEAWLPPGTHLVVRATIESNATAAQGS